jgi:hypothetical protein
MNVGQQMDALLGRGATMEVLTTSNASGTLVTGRAYDVLVINAPGGSARFNTLTAEGGQDMMVAVASGGIGSIGSGTTFGHGVIIAANNGRRITAVTLNQGGAIGYTFQNVTLASAL